jgi:hypothetical protein
MFDGIRELPTFKSGIRSGYAIPMEAEEIPARKPIENGRINRIKYVGVLSD